MTECIYNEKLFQLQQMVLDSNNISYEVLNTLLVDNPDNFELLNADTRGRCTRRPVHVKAITDELLSLSSPGSFLAFSRPSGVGVPIRVGLQINFSNNQHDYLGYNENQNQEMMLRVAQEIQQSTGSTQQIFLNSYVEEIEKLDDDGMPCIIGVPTGQYKKPNWHRYAGNCSDDGPLGFFRVIAKWKEANGNPIVVVFDIDITLDTSTTGYILTCNAKSITPGTNINILLIRKEGDWGNVNPTVPGQFLETIQNVPFDPIPNVTTAKGTFSVISWKAYQVELAQDPCNFIPQSLVLN